MAPLIAFLLLATVAVAQTCEQFGTPLTSTTCSCPPGFSGPTCSLPSCSGTIFSGSQRPAAQPVAGSLYSNLTASDCSCTDGWSGTGCNVCRTSTACQTAFWASNFNTTNGGVAPDLNGDGVDPGQAQNDTIVCNTNATVYASSELSCDVNNPTLQALYPLQSSLTILRTLSPGLSPYPNVSSFGAANSIYAQIWYDGVEQFYCTASSCTQTASNWLCPELSCVCRPNADFCGKVVATNLTATIDTLGGTLEIDCSGSTCYFKQSVLEELFGSNGLEMENCIFGECVRQAVIDAAVGANTTTTSNASSGPNLSGGVIAGLAVVGAFVLAALALGLWGWLDQRKARRAMGADWAAAGEKSRGVGIEWSGLGYAVKTTSPLSLSRSRKGKSSVEDGALIGRAGERVVLTDVSGRIEPGTTVAILGPSGAGKTTAVELLAGKRKEGRAVGTVKFFGADGAPLERRPRIGFVDQSDILPPNLTVRETLLFAARLRLPESMPDSEKQGRVFEVLTQLGLQEVAETRVGSGERRGISGGEMRRVNIGCELVARPAVLILDEPTSGLDSVSASKVAQVLRDLAHDPQNPTCVLASIHQPSSQLYRTFDRVLLLSGGRNLYFGAGGSAPAEYFAARGLPCAEGYNVADHLLDIASAPPPSLNAEQNGIENANGVHPHGSGSQDTVDEVGAAKAAPERRSDGSWDVSHLAVEKGVRAAGTATRFRRSKASPYAATFLTQVQVLSGREWKNLRRDLSLFAAHMAVAIVLGVFTGGLYFHTGITIAGFQSRIGCLFFLGSLLSFSALSALHNLVEIRPLFLRERAGSYYSPSAWLLSRIIFDVIPLRILPTIVVSTITYWMAGLSPEPANFFKFLLILVLYALSMTLFNFLYASIFRNGGIAILLSALFNLGQMTFAGFFVHLDSIPPVLRWLQWLCPLKYALEALSVNEVNSGLMIEDTLEGVPVDVSAQLIMNLLFGFGDGNYYRDVLVLFAFIAGLAVALVSVVWFRLRETR